MQGKQRDDARWAEYVLIEFEYLSEKDGEQQAFESLKTIKKLSSLVNFQMLSKHGMYDPFRKKIYPAPCFDNRDLELESASSQEKINIIFEEPLPNIEENPLAEKFTKLSHEFKDEIKNTVKTLTMKMSALLEEQNSEQIDIIFKELSPNIEENPLAKEFENDMKPEVNIFVTKVKHASEDSDNEDSDNESLGIKTLYDKLLVITKLPDELHDETKNAPETYNKITEKINILLEKLPPNTEKDIFETNIKVEPIDQLKTSIKDILEKDWKTRKRFTWMESRSKPTTVRELLKKIDRDESFDNKTLAKVIRKAKWKHSHSVFQRFQSFFRGRHKDTNKFYGILGKTNLKDDESIQEVIKELETFQNRF